jgi:hypothetical protein
LQLFTYNPEEEFELRMRETLARELAERDRVMASPPEPYRFP